MTQIDDLQGRITGALERLSQSLEAYRPEAPQDTTEVDALRQRLDAAETALAEAQEARAALEERAAADLDTAVAAARAEAEASHAVAMAAAQAEKDAAIAAIRAEAEAAMNAAKAPAPDDSAEDSAASDEGLAAEISQLREALEDEKIANAQLEERLRALKARHQSEAPAPEEMPAVAADPAALVDLDSALQRLRKANAALSESNAALREANAQGVGEPHLINTALLADLEAMRAARAADAAEARALIDVLEPLLAAGDAPETIETEEAS